MAMSKRNYTQCHIPNLATTHCAGLNALNIYNCYVLSLDGGGEGCAGDYRNDVGLNAHNMCRAERSQHL